MGERITFDVNTEQADATIDKLDGKIEQTEKDLVDMGKNVAKETQKSYNEVMGMMRSAYMMVSGITQVLGGSMAKIFESLFSITISAIGTYQAIAAAIAATGPVGWIQAAIMTSSLVAAIINLVAVSEGQKELARRISGLNMTLHGISSYIGYLPDI